MVLSIYGLRLKMSYVDTGPQSWYLAKAVVVGGSWSPGSGLSHPTFVGKVGRSFQGYFDGNRKQTKSKFTMCILIFVVHKIEFYQLTDILGCKCDSVFQCDTI